MKSQQNVCICTASQLLIASLFSITTLFAASCQTKPETAKSQSINSPTTSATSSPSQQTSPVDVRYFKGTGVVTKVVRENPYDKSLASVELDHGEIVGLMPPMRMEFYVKHVSMLDGLKIGDVVDFTIEEKGPTEIISELKKQ